MPFERFCAVSRVLVTATPHRGAGELWSQGDRMKRVSVVLGACILIIGLLLEPTTFRATGADASYPAPWWQTAMAIGDALLLAGCAGYAFERRFAKAQWWLLGECTYNIATTILYTIRDGEDHFYGGFGPTYHLPIYLSLVLLRLLLIGVLLTPKVALAPGEGAG